MSNPKRYEEMSKEERIEVADKEAIFEWVEEQTKGKIISIERKKKKITNFKKALDEMLEVISKPTIYDEKRRWKKGVK